MSTVRLYFLNAFLVDHIFFLNFYRYDAMGSLEGTFDTSLHEAVRYGELDEVKVALFQGYDPNLIGLYQWSALHEAANNGEVEILKNLLKNKG
jgi:ankyrin repeat protein